MSGGTLARMEAQGIVVRAMSIPTRKPLFDPRWLAISYHREMKSCVVHERLKIMKRGKLCNATYRGSTTTHT
jgi:hypothetical protein